ncbi:UDP-N-acetylglucosamine 2-epimerase [Nocardioides bigeumensis]|uniref:UDP-N-acetyl glucosamine 2-epimerase n=1 Tax=Nocardioides bigeumensis TaxID=433657 RepID=A0ABN2XN88_9ACTN
MAIIIVAGTTAELIKLAPLMRALREEGEGYRLWNTSQHVDGFRATLEALDLPQPDEHFIEPSKQTPLVSSAQVPGWMLAILWHALRHSRRLRRQLRSGPGQPLVVVHGDTFTTVLGALIGRLLRTRVAHVEAGMRSGNLWHPLPEELNRRLVARLAHLHFAPSEREVAHLRSERLVRGEVVDTGANTVVDALRLVMETGAPPERLPEVFGLVTLHRFEMLRNAAVFTKTLEVLEEASRTVPLVMPAGNTERRRIEELGLTRLFGERFQLIDKQPYVAFAALLGRASFVVTDSGGLQQECAVIGKPCAVQRETTEAQQGLGENVVLTGLDMQVLRDFLAHWEDYRRPSRLDQQHPTRVILDRLRREGHLANAFDPS